MAENLVDVSVKYNKLSSIVDQVITDLGLTQHYYAKLLSWAIWGLRELKLDQANEVITIRKTLSDVRTVTMPGNYVDWVKIAIPVGQYLKTLSVNAELSKEERTLGNPSLSENWPLDFLPNGINFGEYGGYIFSNYEGNSLFSVGGGIASQGMFTVADRGDGCTEILFDNPMTANECVIEYISNGINPCGETIVHDYLANYVREFILHENERLRPIRERNESAIYRTGRAVADALRNVRARKNDLDPKTMVHISRKYYSLRSKI